VSRLWQAIGVIPRLFHINVQRFTSLAEDAVGQAYFESLWIRGVSPTDNKPSRAAGDSTLTRPTHGEALYVMPGVDRCSCSWHQTETGTEFCLVGACSNGELCVVDGWLIGTYSSSDCANCQWAFIWASVFRRLLFYMIAWYLGDKRGIMVGGVYLHAVNRYRH